ncbi:hypothetical protein CPT_Privateer_060 [Proteus phage Privateer]|uniref:Uncharacterized protein n=1 Tax=Proteus phage Privateer TaxID=2712958 RepID=A0A6G8R3V5_9CAUD|nr:hypothetical protein HWD17_gp060 [Proteus phage Privateer]QIN94853.1 hypothetical protein CPT_Privateer_060 [Proteus phage Privateer]
MSNNIVNRVKLGAFVSIDLNTVGSYYIEYDKLIIRFDGKGIIALSKDQVFKKDVENAFATLDHMMMTREVRS